MATTHRKDAVRAMNLNEETPLSHNETGSRSPFPPALLDKLLAFGVLLVCCTLLVAIRCKFFTAGGNEGACAWITAFSVAVMLLLSIRSRRTILPTFRHGLLSVTFASAMSAFLLVSATVISVYYANFASVKQADESTVISFLMKAFALLTAAYFLLSSATDKLREKKTLHLLLSMAPIFFCALRVLNTFINNSTLPLASSGGYRILGMIFAMLFFLNEGKLLLGMKNASAYQFTGFAAVIFCASYDLPLLITGIREGGSWRNASFSLLTLGLVVYILARIATLPARKEE